MNKIISIEKLTGKTNLVIHENGEHYTLSNRELVKAIADKNTSMENAQIIYNYFTTNLRFSRPLVMEAKTNIKLKQVMEENK